MFEIIYVATLGTVLAITTFRLARISLPTENSKENQRQSGK